MVKLFLIVVLLGVAMTFYETMSTGRRNKGTHQLTHFHKQYAREVLFGLLVFVALVECIVRMQGGSKLDLLFAVHIACAVPLLAALLLLNFRFDGLRSAYHGLLAYAAVVLFLGTFFTGLWMILFRL